MVPLRNALASSNELSVVLTPMNICHPFLEAGDGGDSRKDHARVHKLFQGFTIGEARVELFTTAERVRNVGRGKIQHSLNLNRTRLF